MSKVVIHSIAAAALALPAVAFATPIAPGTYQLHNHPDGGERPPLYGLRLDEMINVHPGSDDIFTFNFDHAGSNMRMDVTANSIHIYGTAWGGRDTGNNADYANDGYRGFYTINFTYSIGVLNVPGDDDRYVSPGTSYNYGSIITPNTLPGGQRTIGLRDGHYGNGQPDFRLGDEDNDQGHRGYHGISGWGWMFFNNGNGWTNTTYDDWLFTATLMPTPGAAALAGLGTLAATRRRRR